MLPESENRIKKVSIHLVVIVNMFTNVFTLSDWWRHYVTMATIVSWAWLFNFYYGEATSIPSSNFL